MERLSIRSDWRQRSIMGKSSQLRTRRDAREDPASLVSVVVADMAPLHCLILCGIETVLARLFPGGAHSANCVWVES
jgi:hypothetical protein